MGLTCALVQILNKLTRLTLFLNIRFTIHCTRLNYHTYAQCNTKILLFSVVLSFKDIHQRLLIGELVAGPGFHLGPELCQRGRGVEKNTECDDG